MPPTLPDSFGSGQARGLRLSQLAHGILAGSRGMAINRVL